MKTIGFTSKYYTLWEVSKDDFTTSDGRKATKVTAVYIKNVSMDKNTAIAKHPDAVVDLSLHGHSSFTRIEVAPMVWDAEVFPCGQYVGQPIAECTDLDYLYWCIDTYHVIEHDDDVRRAIAIDVLVASGKYGRWNNRVLPIEEVTRREARAEAIAEIVMQVEEGKPVVMTSTSNITWNGEQPSSRTSLNVALYWDADMLAEQYYAGCTYYLPMLNGKAKRIKGKNLLIKEAAIVQDDYMQGIKVTKFDIVK